MAPKIDRFLKNNVSKGAWTKEEDRKLSQYIKNHGERRWKSVAVKAGLNRCGRSCRLRWLNYLRPNIKRGNISDQEEDLIIRLHKLLGNRWALIAGRLPGRTDNEIKNYWNSHLSKRFNNNPQQPASNSAEPKKTRDPEIDYTVRETVPSIMAGVSQTQLAGDMFLDFSDDAFVLPSPKLSSYNQQLNDCSDYLVQAEAFDDHFDFCLDLDFPWVAHFLEYDEDIGENAKS